MPGPGMAAMTTAESRNKKKFAAAHLYSMIRKSGYRFSLATNAERVCAEIMLKQRH
jgi:hypothetical protein